MCSCALFVMFCVMWSGLLVCADCAYVCVFDLCVFARIVCDCLCDVVWFACFLVWLCLCVWYAVMSWSVFDCALIVWCCMVFRVLCLCGFLLAYVCLCGLLVVYCVMLYGVLWFVRVCVCLSVLV